MSEEFDELEPGKTINPFDANFTFDTESDWEPGDPTTIQESSAESLDEIEDKYIYVEDLDTSIPIDFSAMAKSRENGITMEKFLKDLELDSALLSRIKPIRSVDYYKELEEMTVVIPQVVQDSKEYHIIYSRLVNYRSRAEVIKNHVDVYYNIIAGACEDYTKMGVSLKHGKNIPDSIAYATNLVKPLSTRLAMVKSLKDHIMTKIKGYDNAHIALGNILKNNESTGRTNYTYKAIGDTESERQTEW